MPTSQIMAMIKCNAYGHGLIEVANALTTVKALGVATISEALQLRSAGIEKDIIVMRGFVNATEIEVFLKDPHLIACIHDIAQIKLLEKHPPLSHQTLRIWLKVDTGMNRLGISIADFSAIYQRLLSFPFIDKNFVVGSHLADADNEDSNFTKNQFDKFKEITRNIPNEKSILNSAGILAHSEFHYDWIRPGLMLYGVSPFSYPGTHDDIMKNFIPVMTLSSQLIAVKTVNTGEKIGYSCTFTAKTPMKIGIVGMGYGDSYPRHAKNGTPVLINGQRCPIVGRVSMDMITVDVSHLEKVAVDDTVILWGEDLLVSEIAQCVNTVPHELLCHLTGRVQRVYKDS